MRIIHWSFIIFITMTFSPSAWASDTTEGKEIFKSSCVYCHGMGDKKKLAPNLTGIGQRRDTQWLNAWLKNPGELLKHDHYAQALLGNNKYGLHMPQIPDMKDDAKRASVIAYLLSEF